MAQIHNDQHQQKTNRTTSNKRSTKVDLTPMVDLGFILITFFVFTSTLTKPTLMNLVVPNDSEIEVKNPVCESCALTLVPGENNELYYYEGAGTDLNFSTTNYSSGGLRNLILEKRKKVMAIRGKDEMVLIIKPSATSNFKNLVNLVDECNISLVKRYYLDEITAAENNSLSEIMALNVPMK